MLRTSKRLYLILTLFLLAALPTLAQKTVKIGTGEYAPYTSQSMSGNGFFAEIATAAFKAVDITPEYAFYPWNRCSYLLENNKLFAIMPYAVTEERKEKFNFSDKVAASTGRFFYLQSRFPQGIGFEEWEDLQDLTLGGTRGYWYEETFEEAGLNVDYTSSDNTNLKKLEGGRIDAFIMNELQGRAMIKENYPNKQDAFAVSEKPADQSWLRLMIAPDYPNSGELTREFNRGLQRIKDNGTYDQILQKYGLSTGN